MLWTCKALVSHRIAIHRYKEVAHISFCSPTETVAVRHCFVSTAAVLVPQSQSLVLAVLVG